MPRDELGGFAIMCARDPNKYPLLPGCAYMAMVDRAKDQRDWWTGTQPTSIMRYRSQGAAVSKMATLKHGEPRVVPYDQAVSMIMSQKQLLDEISAHPEADVDT